MVKDHKSSWLMSLVYLTLFSIAIYFINRGIDYLLLKNDITIFRDMFSHRIDTITNTAGGMGEVVAAVLGIEITAVAIVVQLAANKYSTKIMDIFLNNRVNQLIYSLFVITASNTVLVTNTIHEDFIPYFSIFFTLFLVVLNLLIFVPHFIYVFNFLRPYNFLNYVKARIIKKFYKLSKNKLNYSTELRGEVSEDIDFVGDIAMNSIYQGDRAVTLMCLNTMREFLVVYLELKKDLPDAWFKRTGEEYLDPDFSSYSSFVMQKIEDRKILLERKIFRMFEITFHKSHLLLRDVSGGVLLNTELLAYEAVKNNDEGVLITVFQYFNSYLRLAITDKSPRTAFSALEHYRIVAENLMETKPDAVLQIAKYFRYYGHEANKNGVLFILETAAYDLCRLNELAYEKDVEIKEELLELFLNLDEPIDESKTKEIKTKEKSLIGVRIAQVKLAGYYLLNNESKLADKIFEDMRVEPAHRINKIKDIVFGTKEEEFWEVNPRGVNFYYLSERRKKVLHVFFEKFMQ